MTTLTRRSICMVTVPGTEVEFEAVGPTPDIYDDVWVSDSTTPGARWDVTWLVHDDDAYDLWEWGNPDEDPERWVNGCFRDFRNSRDGGGEDARDAFYEEMVEAVGADRVFIVDVYSHGLDHFSRRMTRNYPDRQWDVAPACVLAVPPDVTNPEEWADGILESYSSWANGDVWGIVTHHVAEDGEVIDYDSVWGFIGHDDASKCAESGGY